MKPIIIITALMLLAALPADAQNTVTIEAHEVRLSTLRLPASGSGSLTFKACDACEYTTRRVTGNTRWELNNKPVSLETFRAALEGIADRNEAYVTVAHDLRSDLIKEVAITVY